MNMCIISVSSVFLLVVLLTATALRFPTPRTISMKFDLDQAASTLSRNKILTKTSELGLLTKLERAGFTLKSAAPLLKFADDNDLLGVLEASSDKVLPLIGTAIEFSPALLPVAGAAIKLPPFALYGGALLSVVSAAAVVYIIPDDSASSIAIQTLVAVPLGVVLPGAFGVGGFLLSKLR